MRTRDTRQSLTSTAKACANGHYHVTRHANATHSSPHNARELSRLRDAGSELAGTHTRIGYAPAMRKRHHHARCCGRLAPTSRLSAGWALCRWLRSIVSMAAADEAHVKREGPNLKAKASNCKAQVRICSGSHDRAREAREEEGGQE
jgi:hypothetical protein|mmetsp:Transcript_50468/g.133350  ORF Transcript_50468/g.133350 Transcript_50468/m.133350 type:complete len:147 (-) Transcript_50468:534-974(-)